jgi:hypothetical protein
VGHARPRRARRLPRPLKLLRLLALIWVAGCGRDILVGSLTCRLSAECAPPSSVCSADGRCVAGCSAESCVGGAACDLLTRECSGGPSERSCDGDSDCDPPDLVCRTSTNTCVAGCTSSDTCAEGFRCDPSSGHCCDGPSCPDRPDAAEGCNSDFECVGAPALICSGGACVPGCGQTGCAAPLQCDPTSGHCERSRCARDADCDDGSACTQASRCEVLAFAGQIECAGGAVVYYRCAIKETPADLVACAGAPGPVGCPYCIDHSCFHPGVCARDGDCHGGDSCVDGLCRVEEPPCPTIVPIADVVNGRFAAGKEVCVRGKVTQVRAGYDGMNEVRLDSSPFLYVDVPPMYVSAGVALPSLGAMVTVHGTVRWDASHDDYELLPVDFIAP